MTTKYIYFFLILTISVFVLPTCIKFGQFLPHPFYIDKSLLISFAVIASLVVLHAKNISKFEAFSSFFYTFSSFGVILAHDLISLLVFFEFMALGAFCIITANKGTAVRYACIHFFAGTLILAGVAAHASNTNSIQIVHSILNWKDIQPDNLMIFAGLLINCASFPFSSWVTDSYPTASLYGTTYLSLFTTKVSSYILLLLFQGSETLFYFGLTTAFCAVTFAILENNIRRFLCYNLIGQMGLIITGIGFSGKAAASGVILQIIFCTVYQCLLFMVANSIIWRTQKVNFSEIGGLLTKMPAEALYCLIGILTMAATPGTSAFISKSLITLADNSHILITKLFLLANFMLFVGVGLKFFYFAFIHKQKQVAVAKGNFAIYIAMFILSLICILAGVFYKEYIPYLLDDVPNIYQRKKVLMHLGLLICSAVSFMFLRRLFAFRVNFTMDIDWIYRSFFPYVCDNMLFIAESSAKIIKSVVSSTAGLYCSNQKRVIVFLDYKSLSFVVVLATGIIGILLILCLSL